ncbi:protoglobin domain-containing protein [Nisaea sp.]|uniref:protoglobin domain-containing protein n=1 Tax=Nisaea sp. TaxID=2024842 RepID=UPI003B52F5D3
MDVGHKALNAEERISFLQIDQSARALLGEFSPILERNLSAILDGFYAHVMTVPQLAEMFVSEDRVRHAREGQSAHWKRLFSGEFGEEYFDSIQRIGRVHNRLGLEPRWYIGGYAAATTELHRLAIEHCMKGWRRNDAAKKAVALVQAIDKAVMLDMELAISVYLEEQSNDFRNRLEGLSDQFQASITGVTGNLLESAAQLSERSSSMTSGARDCMEQTKDASRGAAAASENVQSVASAAEELSASIGEISHQLAESNKIAQEASEAVDTTKLTVEGLNQAAAKISGVVSLIQDIAEQTNLLALNATIEAARAGEAGKGFAVVASEVKALANQTSNATDEISEQVSGMQQVAEETRSGIENISSAMSKVGDSSAAISAAVEEQDAVTREISQSAAEAHRGTAEVQQAIGAVEDSVTNSAEMSEMVSESATYVTEQAGELKRESGEFIEKLWRADRRAEDHD